MTDRLEQELVRIGLSEKEAKVYLAALALGAGTAQQIAAKATVARPTTYIMIESLVKQGLLSSYIKGKKSCYAPAGPDKLLGLAARARRELEERERRITALVAELEQAMARGGARTFARLAEGEVGLDEARAICRGGEALVFAPTAALGREIAGLARSARVLHSLPSGRTANFNDKNDVIEFRQVDAAVWPAAGTIAVCGTRTALLAAPPDRSSVIIDDNSLSTTIRTLFLALWKQAASARTYAHEKLS